MPSFLNGIELCGFMIHPSGFLVKMMTKAAGMPVGNGGKLDWRILTALGAPVAVEFKIYRRRIRFLQQNLIRIFSGVIF